MSKTTCTNCGNENAATNKFCSRCGYALPKIETEIPTSNFQQHSLESKSKKKNIAGLIVGLISFFLVYWAVQHFIFKAPSFDTQLNALASEINKSCPMMIDQETQFDNAIAMPGKVFQYNYTLVNIVKGTVDTLEIKNYIIPRATRNIKTSPDLKYQRENKIALKYYYKDKNGDYLFSFTLTPDQYEN